MPVAEEPVTYEPGTVRDLIRDAGEKYRNAHPSDLRRLIDHDTMYLGKMDVEQLKVPAKEAMVPIARGASPEQVRRGIRDVIQASAQAAHHRVA